MGAIIENFIWQFRVQILVLFAQNICEGFVQSLTQLLLALTIIDLLYTFDQAFRIRQILIVVNYGIYIEKSDQGCLLGITL